MTTESALRQAAHLPRELRWICKHDSFSVEGCVTCAAADAIDAALTAPPAAEPQRRCAGCDLPNGCPEYCGCAALTEHPYYLAGKAAVVQILRDNAEYGALERTGLTAPPPPAAPAQPAPQRQEDAR
jgi:hypothetical protein